MTSSDGVCSSDQSVDIGLCSGGCESKADYCCQPAYSIESSIDLACVNGTSVNHEVTIVYLE